MIEHYRNWGLLYEDQFQCFSKAIEIETNTNVLVISHFKSNRIKKSVKTLLPDLLNHYLDSFEDENGFHIVLKYLKGYTLSSFLKAQSLPYETRVQLCYQWIKSIVKYDQFPDALKIQLVDYEQLIVFNEQFFSREWIDFSADEEVDYIKILKQLGQTLEVIFPDAPPSQNQFIEALSLGKHQLISLAMFRKAYKDIFLYEKEDAVKQLSFEYDIVLNDLTAGPPLKLPVREMPETHTFPSTEDSPSPKIEQPVLPQDITPEDESISTIKTENASILSEIKVMQIKPEDFEEDTSPEEPLLQSYDEIHFSNPLSDYLTPSDSSTETISAQAEVHNDLVKENVETIIEIEEDEVKIDETTNPPLSKPIESTKYWLEDDSEIDDYAKEMDALFEEDDFIEKKWHFKSKSIILAILIGVLILFSILFIGSKIFVKDEPILAQFNIEKQLETSRVPIINTSTGGKNIQSYLWEIYYQDALIKTYNDKDLELSLETPGAYRIILKIKDSKGNWSLPYERTYHYIP